MAVHQYSLTEYAARLYDPIAHGQHQARRVRDCLLANRDRWLTLDEIGRQTGDPGSSVSARIRQLREDYGYTIALRTRAGYRNLQEYQIRLEHPE